MCMLFALQVLSRKIVDPQNFHILYKKVSTKGEKQAMSDAFSLSMEVQIAQKTN